MIYRSHIFVRISLLFCLLTSTALIAKDPVARVIETETRRQADVGASLDTSLDSMAAIMEDLESNEMFTGDDVSKMKGITGILKNLKDVTLPNATKALKNAKGDNRIAKLEKASLEMALVIRQLDKLMTATGLEEKRRIYRALLQDIIDDQWMMLRDTVSWGRVLLEDGKTGNVGPDLSQGQYLLNEKFGTYVFDIKLDLKTAVEGEELAKLITQLLVCFVKTQVDTQQKKAAEAITVKDPAQSAGNQQAALKGLHAAMDILNGVDPNMAERAEAIASILMEIKLIVEKERALRLTIVRGGNEKFKKTNGAHLKEQHVITAMLKKIADDKPPVGEDILNAIAKALKEMGKAEKYIGDVKRKPAMGAQMRAIFILEEILETLDSLEMAGHMAEGAEGLMEFGMGEASGQSLSGETDMGVGMGSGMEAEMGIGGEGEGEGEGEGGEGMPEGLSDLPPMSAEEVTIGEVRTGDGVIGKNVFTSGKQSKGHLDMNARKHVQQLYQESLPPEFRGMAQDYFEVLGAEE